MPIGDRIAYYAVDHSPSLFWDSATTEVGAALREQTPFASPAESAMPTPVGESSDLAAESLEPAQAPDRPLGELAMIDLVRFRSVSDQ